jgi:hypothetical protein
MAQANGNAQGIYTCSPRVGRYVRLWREGQMSLCEVFVQIAGSNKSPVSATASSIAGGTHPASRLIDGDASCTGTVDMTYKTGSPNVAITDPARSGQHSFVVDLGSSIAIERVLVNLAPKWALRNLVYLERI